MENKLEHHPIEKHFSKITRYHITLFLLIFIAVILFFWQILSFIFLAPPINFYCNDFGTKEKAAVKNVSLRNVCPCDNPWWDDSMFTMTFQSKFNLNCEKAWLVNFGNSMSNVGLLIGSLLFGYCSDRYGRRLMLTASGVLIGVAGCLVSTMPTAITTIVMRTISSAGIGGGFVTSYVICIEYCGLNSHREIFTVLYHLPGCLAHLSLPLISHLIPHCDYFQLFISIPNFLFVGLHWVIMESPKWLLDNNYMNEAIVVMQKFCKFNKLSSESIEQEITAYHADLLQKEVHTLNFFQIFKHKQLTINLICMSINYFGCGIGYYGISQFVGRMSGNIFVNVAISAALLIPGTLLSLVFMKVCSRQIFLMSTNFLCSLFLIIFICIPDSVAYANIFQVAAACISLSFIFMSFINVFLYGVELFPTSVRNTALGFLSCTSRIGQIVGPQVNDLSPVISGGVFAGIILFCAVMCYPLSETKNTILPSSYEDTINLTHVGFTKRTQSS